MEISLIEIRCETMLILDDIRLNIANSKMKMNAASNNKF